MSLDEVLSRLGDKSICLICGGKDELAPNERVCTSCVNKTLMKAARKYGTSDTSTMVDAAIGDISHRLGLLEVSDDELFQDPPPKEDCPICMLPIPHDMEVCGVSTQYMACCGKLICRACISATDGEIRQKNIKDWCLFCRKPTTKFSKDGSNEEELKRLENRMKLNDAYAFYELSAVYKNGHAGIPKDKKKVLELWNRAADLGLCNAHNSLAEAYYRGDHGVKEDVNKAAHHWMLAAIGGHELARHNVGALEKEKGRMDRAMKHFMMAARSGADNSLKQIGLGYKAGHVTKDDYASILRAHKASQDEMKSEQRARAEIEEMKIRRMINF